MRKIAIGFIVLFATLALVGVAAAGTAGFPNKRITYNICFNPGGESDITARFQEQPLKKVLGQDIAINYKIGGGGALCWAELVQTKPDGYTIAGHNLPHTVLQPLEMGNAGYKTLDLKQIYFFESTPNLLLVRTDSPFKTLKDFVEYAKKTPGAVTVGGSGTSSANDLGTTMLNKAAGIQADLRPLRRDRVRRPRPPGRPRDRADELLHHGHPVCRQVPGPGHRRRTLGWMSCPMCRPSRSRAMMSWRGPTAAWPRLPGPRTTSSRSWPTPSRQVHKDPEVKKKMDQNGFKTEFMGPEASLALVKKKMVEYEEIMKALGRIKK